MQRVVDENAANLKQYGLEPAADRGRVPQQGAEGPQRIADRREDADRRRPLRPLPDQKRVFLVSSFLDSTFNKNPFALRDKPILKIDRDKVDGLELTERRDEDRVSRRTASTGAREAGRRACRLRRGRGRARAPRRPRRCRASSSRTGSDLAKYGLDEADGHDHRRAGQLARDADARARRRTPSSSRRTRRGRWSSPSRRCSRPT